MLPLRQRQHHHTDVTALVGRRSGPGVWEEKDPQSLRQKRKVVVMGLRQISYSSSSLLDQGKVGVDPTE